MAYSKNKRRIIEDSESEDDNNDEKLDSDNTPGLAHEIPNKNVDVLSLTDADKTVMDKCKIFISQTNGKYCATAMEEAISKIKAIIQPINKNVDSWDEYQRYCIHEDKSKRDDFFARGLYHPSTHEGVSPVSEETLLLEVSALRNSSKAVKGRAIKTKALSVVFGPWWNYTLCRMLKILPHYKDGPDEELKSYTAVKLFLAMIDFIKEEKDVMKAGCLPKFKHDFGVNWIDCIMRAKLLFNHYSSKLLQNALIEAQKRVQSLGGVFDETKKERSGIYTSQVRQRQSKQGKSEVVVNSSEYNNATTRDGNREAPRTRVVPNASQDDEWGRVRDGSGPEPPKSKGCWEFRRGALSSKTSFYINGSKDHLFVVHGEHGGNKYGGGRNLGRGNYGGRGGGRGGGRFSGGRSGPRFGGGRLGNGGGRGGGDYYGPPAGIRCDHDRHGDRY